MLTYLRACRRVRDDVPFSWRFSTQGLPLLEQSQTTRNANEKLVMLLDGQDSWEPVVLPTI